MPGLDPEKLRRLLLVQDRRRVRRQRARQDHRHARDRTGKARLSLCAGRAPAPRAIAAARRIDVALTIDQGPRDLCRAHRHPRQHPHPRLCDPARIRHRRRRCLQQGADRSRRTAAEEPELFQDRQDHDQARLGAGSRRARCRGGRTSRPAISTSPAAIRPPTACSPRSRSATAISSAPASRVKSSVTYGQYARRRRPLGVGAVFPRHPGLGRHRPVRPSRPTPARYQSYGTQSLRRDHAARHADHRADRRAMALFDLAAGRHARSGLAGRGALAADPAGGARRPAMGLRGRRHRHLQHARQHQEPDQRHSIRSSRRISPASAAT